MSISARRITVFVAGATGAIGRRLVPRLVQAGYRVIGMSRDATKAEALLDAGAIPMMVDVFDAERLQHIMLAARPDAVVHLLTDLPRDLDASRMEEGILRNARMRAEGTAKLMLAAKAAGTRRMWRKASPGRTRHSRGPIPRAIHWTSRRKGCER